VGLLEQTAYSDFLAALGYETVGVPCGLVVDTGISAFGWNTPASS